MKKEGVSFVQPLHSYAHREGEGQIYLPSSLLVAAARAIEAGADVVDIQDANLHPLQNTAPLRAVSLLGAPYVERARELIQPGAPRLIVGGQVISGFIERNSEGEVVNRSQFDRLFGESTVNGNDDVEFASALGVTTEGLPAPHTVSLISAYERISDEDMQKYLSHEFSFFLSQGCKFACTFCAAVRTMVDPLTKEKVKEQYRDMEVVEKDLDYLITRAESLGLSKIEFYLSNLDVFQSPKQLKEFADTVLRLKERHPGFAVGMRGLATVDSFLKTHDKQPEVILEMKDAGLHTVGFDIDGTTPKVWKSIHKAHNTEDKCINGIRIARETYNLTPEALMVFGHPEEDEESLADAYDFTVDMVQRYGAVPRPHVAKDIIPGNENWRLPQNARRVDFLLEHPEYFQALDFTALPSSISHPDSALRKLVERYYLMICGVSGNVTNPIYPLAPEDSQSDREVIQAMNKGRWDR